MKTPLSLFLIALSSTLMAYDFVVEATNTIHIAFEDTSLSDDIQRIIAEDMQRNALQAQRTARLEVYPGTGGTEGRIARFFHVEGSYDCGTPTDVSIRGTNIVLTLDKWYTDCYVTNAAFFATHSNEIAQAYAMCDFWATNSFQTASTSNANDFVLSKEFAPGEMTDAFWNSYKKGLAGDIFPPSLLVFYMDTSGPSGEDKYLWGSIPCFYEYSIIPIPIVYYNNKWWISAWQYEEGQQTW